MSRRILHSVILSVLLAAGAAVSASGQTTGTYTPYSIYGVGDLSQPGSAYSKTMGGAGVALRNNRYLNLINPAAVTARDSLAFMADFSLYNDNKMFQQAGIKSASNTFNINDLAMSFPIWRKSAMMVGIMPYSDTGFGYSFYYTDPQLIGQTGNISYSATGTGSLYKAFAAAGVTLFKRLPKDEYDTLIAACDVGLIFLDHRFTIPNFPSRMLGYMQARLPILACTDPNTDIGDIISRGGYGWKCESDDPKTFAGLVSDILSADRASMGEAGYEYLQKHYTTSVAYDIIMKQ